MKIKKKKNYIILQTRKKFLPTLNSMKSKRILECWTLLIKHVYGIALANGFTESFPLGTGMSDSEKLAIAKSHNNKLHFFVGIIGLKNELYKMNSLKESERIMALFHLMLFAAIHAITNSIVPAYGQPFFQLYETLYKLSVVELNSIQEYRWTLKSLGKQRYKKLKHSFDITIDDKLLL